MVVEVSSRAVQPILSVFSSLLMEMAAVPQAAYLRGLHLTEYMGRVVKATSSSSELVVVAFLLSHRFVRLYPHASCSDDGLFKLFMVSLILAQKFLYDRCYTNATWAKVSGFPVTLLNEMEIEFLGFLQFNVYVSAEEVKAAQEWIYGLMPLDSFEGGREAAASQGEEAQVSHGSSTTKVVDVDVATSKADDVDDYDDDDDDDDDDELSSETEDDSISSSSSSSSSSTVSSSSSCSHSLSTFASFSSTKEDGQVLSSSSSSHCDSPMCGGGRASGTLPASTTARTSTSTTKTATTGTATASLTARVSYNSNHNNNNGKSKSYNSHTSNNNNSSNKSKNGSYNRSRRNRLSSGASDRLFVMAC